MELGFRVETALRKKWGSDWKEIQEVFKALCSIYIFFYLGASYMGVVRFLILP